VRKGSRQSVWRVLPAVLGLAILMLPGAVARSSAAAPTAARAAIERGLAAYTAAQNRSGRSARLRGFDEAERALAAAVAAGANGADLYADLGNAALQAEHLGTAILAFRRALVIDPLNPRALTNLSYARELLPSWVPRPSEHGWLDGFLALHRRFPTRIRAAAGAVLFLLTCLLLAAASLRQSVALRSLALVPAILWATLVISLASQRLADRSAEAVITVDDVLARAADSEHAPLRFREPLPAGTEVRVIERREGWAHVAFAGGREAWLKQTALKSVLPEP